MAKYLMIVNSGPEDANRATAPFLTAKALVEKGQEVFFWFFNQAVYLLVEGCAENVQAPSLPPLEDLLLFLTMTNKCRMYIGVSCAMGRGLVDQDLKPTVTFTSGELVTNAFLADLIMEADEVISF